MPVGNPGLTVPALTTLPFLLEPKSAHVVISLSGIPVMAMAAETVIAEPDRIVPIGVIPPDEVINPPS